MTITKKTTAVAVALATILTTTIAPAVNETTEFTATTLTAEAATVYCTGTYSVGVAGGSTIGSNVRSGPDTSYSIVGAASYGVNFQITQVSDKWGFTPAIQTCGNGMQSGWIYLPYCTLQTPILPEPTPIINSKINIEAMHLYAKTHWSNYNTLRYRSYKSSASDCCNFCAQILIAGGLPETSEFHGSYDWADVTSSFSYIPDFIAYMRKEYGVKYYNNKSSLGSACKDGATFTISDISAGDCITINGTYGRNHIMYVLGVSGSYVQFTAHTNDRYYGLNGGSIHISSISGVLKTSDITLATPHTHSYTSTVSVWPDCKSEGIRTYNCSCGHSYTEAIAATGHSMNEWTTMVIPTCLETGRKQRGCKRCSYIESVPIAATGHSYTTTVVAATHTAQGYTVHDCINCDYSYKDAYTAKLVLPSVSGFSIAARTSSTITLGWNKSTNADGYVIQKQIDGAWSNIAVLKSNAITTYKVNNLKPDTSYRFRMVAFKSETNNSKVYSKYTSSLASYTAPAKPQHLRMTNRSTDFVSVRWDKNEKADGYMVYIYDGTGWKLVKTMTSNSAVSHKITGLVSGKTYKVTVKAYKTVNGMKLTSDTTTISTITL